MSAVPVVCWLDWKFRPCVAPAPFPPGVPVTRLKNRLVAEGLNVIRRGADADGFPNIRFRASAKM